jgi:hypothetical protein
MGYRNIARATDERTLISSIGPFAAYSSKFSLVFLSDPNPTLSAAFVACCNSFALDFIARQKIGGTDVAFHYFRQLPIIDPSVFRSQAPWDVDLVLADWITARVLELAFTAWDVADFARDLGYQGAPYRWDPMRRALLRSELDAAFFHLYHIDRDDLDYIMDTFPIVRKNDEKTLGDYRTKRLILGVYDAMADAVESGKAYRTVLDPPPADSRVAHPAS